LLLLPLENSWEILDAAISEFEPDFKLQRNQPDSDLRPDINDK
jgi:antitoxin VapB